MASVAPIPSFAEDALVSPSSNSILFEENRGQFDDRVLFRARIGASSVWIAAGEAVHRLPIADRRADAMVIRQEWVGASAPSESLGRGEARQRNHYLRGNDPERWVTDVRHFEVVRLHDVYPGIDICYHERNGQLEYDFLVEPGVDPSQIVLRYRGITGLSIADDGALHVRTTHGTLVEGRPEVFQQIDGERVEVEGRFRWIDERTVGFAVDADPAFPLLIDPVVNYSSFIGGSGNDGGAGSFPGNIALGTDGTVYVLGTTDSDLDFPTVAGYQPDFGGGTDDVTVTQLERANSGADDVIFSTYLGGDGLDIGYGIDVDSNGQVYVCGQTYSADFPVLGGLAGTATWTPTQTDDNEGFVTKLSSGGDALEYSTLIGGDGEDRVVDVVVYEDGDTTASITGFTSSDDFPVTDGAYDTERSTAFCQVPAAIDVFVARLNESGDEVIYGSYLGGEGFDTPYALTVDEQGDIYVVGGIGSDDEVLPKGAVDDPLGRDAFDTELVGNDACIYTEGFVAKFNPQGNGEDDLVYLTYLGGGDTPAGSGGGSEYVFAVFVDTDLNAYVAGRTPATDFPRVNPLADDDGGEPQEGKDMSFVTRLNPWGTDADFSTFITGPDPSATDPWIEWAYGVGTDPSGAIWVAGQTPSTELPTTADAIQPIHGDTVNGVGDGQNDVWLAQLDFDAGGGLTAPSLEIAYLTYLGGSEGDCQFGFEIDEDGGIWIGGMTSSTNFPTTSGAYQEFSGGDTDLFVTRITAEPQFRRGDPDGDGLYTIVDVISMLAYLFLGNSLTCFDAAYSNDDGSFNIADVIYQLSFLYAQGTPPPAPYPDCGLDETADDLPCADYPVCP